MNAYARNNEYRLAASRKRMIKFLVLSLVPLAYITMRIVLLGTGSHNSYSATLAALDLIGTFGLGICFAITALISRMSYSKMLIQRSNRYRTVEEEEEEEEYD